MNQRTAPKKVSTTKSNTTVYTTTKLSTCTSLSHILSSGLTGPL